VMHTGVAATEGAQPSHGLMSARRWAGKEPRARGVVRGHGRCGQVMTQREEPRQSRGRSHGQRQEPSEDEVNLNPNPKNLLWIPC
jgi:hypothetical protein